MQTTGGSCAAAGYLPFWAAPLSFYPAAEDVAKSSKEQCSDDEQGPRYGKGSTELTHLIFRRGTTVPECESFWRML